MEIGIQSILTGVDRATVFAVFARGDHQQSHVVQENPSAPPHDRQTEFSNARCCPQLAQVKSRIEHTPSERRRVRRDVDHVPSRWRMGHRLFSPPCLAGFVRGGFVCSAVMHCLTTSRDRARAALDPVSRYWGFVNPAQIICTASISVVYATPASTYVDRVRLITGKPCWSPPAASASHPALVVADVSRRSLAGAYQSLPVGMQWRYGHVNVRRHT